MTQCKIKVNLKYLSPTTKKLLGLTSNSINVESKEELANELAKILFITQKEKELLLDEFNNYEIELENFAKELEASINYKGKKLNINRPKLIVQDENNIEEQVRKESIQERILEGQFNYDVSKIAIDFSNSLISKVNKYIDGKKFNRDSFPTLSKSDKAIQRLESQIIPYLKNVFFELSILSKANLSNKKEIDSALNKLKYYFENQKQVLFFPKYLSPMMSKGEEINVYWITNNPSDFGIEIDSNFDKIEDNFDTFVNDMLINNAINNLDYSSELSEKNVYVSIKNKDNTYGLYKIKKINTPEGDKLITSKVFRENNISENFLFIPDVDYLVNNKRDFSLQWENEASINSLISPRVNKEGDNLYNFELDKLEIMVSDETTDLPNQLISSTLTSAKKEVGKFAQTFLSSVMDDFVFSQPVFLKGRQEVLKDGSLTWQYTNEGWQLIKRKPKIVITKGLTQEKAYPVFSNEQHIGNLDTLNFYKLFERNGLLTTQKVDLLNLSYNDFQDLSEENFNKLTEEDKVRNFILDYFSVDYNYLKSKNLGYIINLKTNEPVNIPLNQLLTYSNYDVSSRQDVINVINEIVNNYLQKIELLRKAKNYSENSVKNSIKAEELGIEFFPKIAPKKSNGIGDYIPEYDIEEIFTNDKFTYNSISEIKTIPFKTYFRENNTNVPYLVLTNIKLPLGSNQYQVNENVLLKVSEVEDYIKEGEFNNDLMNVAAEILQKKSSLKSEQTYITSDTKPKIILIENSVYAEIDLSHKKIKSDVLDFNELIDTEYQLTLFNFFTVSADYSFIAEKIIKNLRKGNISFWSEDVKRKFNQLKSKNLELFEDGTDRLKPKIKNPTKEQKEQESLNYGKLLNLVEELGVYIYNNSKSFYENKTPLKENEDKFVGFTIVERLLSPDRFDTVINRLNHGFDLSLFNIIFTQNDNKYYIPVNNISKSALRPNVNSVYGFKYTNDSKNLDQMFAFSLEINPTESVDIKKSLVDGWFSRLEYVLFIEPELFNFNLKNSELSKVSNELQQLVLTLKKQYDDKDASLIVNDNKYIELSNKVKETYSKTLDINNNLVNISYNTKKADWVTGNGFLAKNKLVTNLDKDFPIYKTIKYRKPTVIGEIPILPQLNQSEYQLLESSKENIKETESFIEDISKDNNILGQLNELLEKDFSKKDLLELNKITIDEWVDFIATIQSDLDLADKIYDFIDSLDDGTTLKDNFNQAYTISQGEPLFKLESEIFKNDKDLTEKDLEELKNILPQITIEQWENIKDLIGRNKFNSNAVGVSFRNLIAIKENKVGVLFHEAMHQVIDNLFTPAEKIFYLSEIEQRFPLSDNDIISFAKSRNISDLNYAKEELLMEKLADEFALYKLNKPSTLIGKLSNWLKSLFNKILSWINLDNKILTLFSNIEKGKYKNRASNNSKYTRYMLFYNQNKELVSPRLIQGSQKYLFYLILHTKFDYLSKDNINERVEELGKLLNEYLNKKVNYETPKDYNTLKSILLTNKKEVDLDKLKEYYIPYLQDAFNILFEEDEYAEDDVEDGKNAEKDKPFDTASYNQDPSKIGGELKMFISQMYLVKDDSIIPEFVYVDTEKFVKKIQKLFSTVPINPEEKIKSFWQNLNELSEYDLELDMFKNLIEKTYDISGGINSDLTLLNKLVSKITLNQQYYSKGLVEKKKLGSNVFDEFVIKDAFQDSFNTKLNSLLKKGVKNSIKTSDFVLVQFNKSEKVELLKRTIVREGDDTFTFYQPLKTNIKNTVNNTQFFDESEFKVLTKNFKKDKKKHEVKKHLLEEFKTADNFKKAAIISYLHSLVGININLTYAHLFAKTYGGKNVLGKPTIEEVFAEFETTKLNPESKFLEDALRYGNDLQVLSIKAGDGKSVYALTKNSALEVFKKSYQERIENGYFIPQNKIFMSLLHKENQDVDFTDLNLAQHIQFSIGQFKLGRINLDQLEGNKTNFFIKVDKNNYTNEEFYHGIFEQYRKNINQIIINYETVLKYCDENGLMSEESKNNFINNEWDSINNIKFEKVDNKFKPIIRGKGYRIYYQHGLDINKQVDDINKNKFDSTNNREIFNNRIKELQSLFENINNTSNKKLIDKLVSDTVNEITNVLQNHLLKTNATNITEKVDYTQDKYKNWLTNYVRTYLIQTDKIYSEVFGNLYFEAFKDSTADFTKRMKSLAAFGEPIHQHTQKFYNDPVFYTVENTKALTEQGSYRVITEEEYNNNYKSNLSELEKEGWKISKVEAADGQGYNTFLHKYFIQHDKGRMSDEARAYYTYLLTNGNFLYKRIDDKIELEKVIKNPIIENNYKFDSLWEDKIKTVKKFEKIKISQEDIDKALELAEYYGITNSDELLEFLESNKESLSYNKERLNEKRRLLKNTYEVLNSDGTIDTQSSLNILYEQLKQTLSNRDFLLHQLWVDENGKKRKKAQILTLNTQMSNDYKDTLDDLAYLHSEIDRYKGDVNGNSYLINELINLKAEKGELINQIDELNKFQEDAKVILKYINHLQNKQEYEEIINDSNFKNAYDYFTQQDYISKIEEHAVRNKYKNGIFKGVTIFKSEERTVYVKNSEATLERSLYMTPNLEKEVSITRKLKLKGQEALDEIYTKILNTIVKIEELTYLSALGKEDEEYSLDSLKNSLKSWFTKLYDIHEPIKGQERVFNLYKELETNNIEVAAYKSGVKVNNHNKLIDVRFGGKMDQSEMPNDKNKVVFGTQLEKIILDDLDPESDTIISGQIMKVKDVKSLYLKAIENIVNFGVAEIESQLFPDGKLNIKTFSDLLKQFVGTTRNANYFETFFNVIENENKELVFEGVPDIAAIANIYFQTLQKIVGDPARFKMNGEAYQLVSTTAYMVMRDENGDNIPLDMRRDKTGKIEPLQPILEELEIEDENGNKVKAVREVHETVIPASEPWMREYIKDRKVLSKAELELKYPKELFYAVGNRIPTENKRSIAILKIVDFLIPQTGSTIISTAAVQAHTGGDHDGDKFFTLRYNVEKINGVWQKVNRNTEISDKSLSEHLLTKSIFSNIIDKKSKLSSIDSFINTLEKYDVKIDKAALQNELIDYVIALQSNDYILNSKLQHEATDETSDVYKEKVKQSKEFDQRSPLYKSTGSPLKIDYGIVQATKGKQGVGISANTKVVIMSAEQIGVMLKNGYTFGKDFEFSLVGTIQNQEVINSINDLDKDFVSKFNKWVDLNYNGSDKKLSHNPLALMSTKNAILITINTDTVKNEFDFGINLNEITLALYQIGAALNIPTNILLHIGTHPLIREYTANPTKESLKDIENKINDLSSLLTYSSFNKNYKNGKYGRFEPKTLDFKLDELFYYGVGYDDKFSWKNNQVIIYYPQSDNFYKNTSNDKKFKIETFDKNTLSTIIELAENNPENKYYLESLPKGLTFKELSNITDNVVDDIPENLIINDKYFREIKNEKNLEKLIADYKLLVFVYDIYKFGQNLRLMQSRANVNKGQLSIAQFFNLVNLLKQPNYNFDKREQEKFNKLTQKIETKINYNIDNNDLKISKFGNNSLGQYMGISDNFLDIINIPDNSNPLLHWANLSGFQLDSSYKSQLPLLANLLQLSALTSTEGIQIINKIKTNFFDDKTIEYISFIKYAALLKGTTKYSQLVENINRFSNIEYTTFEEFTDDDGNLSFISEDLKTPSKVTNDNIKEYMKYFKTMLSLKYNNTFTKLFDFKIEKSTTQYNEMIGLPIIDNRSQTLDVTKEHIINDIKDILSDNTLVENTNISFSEMLKTILEFEYYIKAGEWSNTSLVSFTTAEETQNFTNRIKKYENLKKLLNKEDQITVGNLTIDLSDYILESKLWNIKVPYLYKSQIESNPNIDKVISLNLDKRTEKDERTVVTIQSFEAKNDLGQYVKLGNAVYKRTNIKSLVEKEETEIVINENEDIETNNNKIIFENHSGGAYGADTFWDLIGRKNGFNIHNHYRSDNNIKLSKKLQDIAIVPIILEKEKMDIAKDFLEILFKTKYNNSIEDSLKIRNYYQVINSDSVFAIAKLTTDNKSVLGGTNTAVQLSIKLNKPVYVWDINSENWYKYSTVSNKFEKTDTPILTKHFAGIGSRDIENYKVLDKDSKSWVSRENYVGEDKENKAKQAIDDVYKNTLKNIEKIQNKNVSKTTIKKVKSKLITEDDNITYVHVPNYSVTDDFKYLSTSEKHLNKVGDIIDLNENLNNISENAGVIIISTPTSFIEITTEGSSLDTYNSSQIFITDVDGFENQINVGRSNLFKVKVQDIFNTYDKGDLTSSLFKDLKSIFEEYSDYINFENNINIKVYDKLNTDSKTYVYLGYNGEDLGYDENKVFLSSELNLDYTTSDAFTTLLFKRDFEYQNDLRDLTEIKKSLELYEDSKILFLYETLENLFITKYGFELLPEELNSINFKVKNKEQDSPNDIQKLLSEGDCNP